MSYYEKDALGYLCTEIATKIWRWEENTGNEAEELAAESINRLEQAIEEETRR